MLALLLAALTLPQPPTAPLEAQLRRMIAASGAEVAVAYRTLDGGVEVLVDVDKPFHAASTMKVPVMIELFRQTRSGAYPGRKVVLLKHARRYGSSSLKEPTNLRAISRSLELHWTPPKNIANQIVHAYRANSSFD